jgi:putative ABC transport system permease protein
MSATAGLAVAAAAVRLLAWWNPASIPRVAAVSIDGRVALFTTLLALMTSILFGLAPALRAVKLDLVDALKDGSQASSSGGARQRFRNALVVSEMALAVVLLVGAGLMLRSLWTLQSTPLGLQPANVLTLRVALPRESYPTPERVVATFQRILDEVRRQPGVQTAGAARALPLASTIGDFGLTVDGYVAPPGTNAKGDWQIVTDGYLEAIGETVIRGRSITAADTSDSGLVMLINEEMARRYWAGRDPIGGRARVGNNPSRPWLTVVGIVRDVHHNGLTEPVKEKFYVPHTQWHKSIGNPIRAMTIVIKSTTPPPTLMSGLRGAVAGVDPNLPIADVRTMDDVVAATMSAPRFTGMLLAAFAALALVLSAIGIYGVLSYLVSRRTREIGIRVAIGAGRAQVLRLVLGSGLTLAFAGVAIGLGVAAAASRVMASLLHGVSPGDPATFLAVGILLPLVALVASAVPAWRATRVDPIVALKTE